MTEPLKFKSRYVLVPDHTPTSIINTIDVPEGCTLREATPEEVERQNKRGQELMAAMGFLAGRTDKARDAQETSRAKRRAASPEDVEKRREEIAGLITAYVSDKEYYGGDGLLEAEDLLAGYDVWISEAEHRRGNGPMDYLRRHTHELSPVVAMGFLALVRKRHYDRCPTAHFALLGGFDVASGELVLSDPCYPRGTWCAGTVPKARNGRWLGFVRYACDWGLRPFVLAAMHADMNPTPFRLPRNRAALLEDGWMKLDVHVGVDSGQAGVFDAGTYRQDTVIGDVPIFCRNDKERGPGDLWYGACCDKTLDDERGAGVISGGVVSRSGLGDGGYAAYGLVADGTITGVIIDFQGDLGDRDE